MLIFQNLILTCYLYTYPLLNPFLPNVKVNYTDHFTHRPCIGIAPSEIIYVVYNVDIGWGIPESTHIYLNKSFDCGSSFVYPDRMIIEGNKYNECLALEVDKNESLHLVYEHYPNLSSKDKLYYASSTDSGQSFPLRTRVDDNSFPVGIGLADIAVDDSGYIYVVWNDKRAYYSHIYFSRSTDSGLTFSENVRVDTGVIHDEGYQPSITLDDECTIYLVWVQENSFDDVHFCKSTDMGNSFTEKVEVDPFSFRVGHPDISVIGNDTILVTYVGTSSANNLLYISRSIDGGTTFTNTVRVNDSIYSFCRRPSICVTQDRKIHIIWEMIFDPLQEMNEDIYYDFSTDGGLSFDTDIMVNDHTEDSVRQQPTLDKDTDGNIYVAWNDWRNGPGDIYFARTMLSGVAERKKGIDTLSISSPCKFFQNPSNPSYREITIKYQVLYPSYIKLEILDLTGRIIRTLVDGKKQVGYYNAAWKGDDSSGKSTSSGVYFVRLSSRDFTSVKKIIFVK